MRRNTSFTIYLSKLQRRPDIEITLPEEDGGKGGIPKLEERFTTEHSPEEQSVGSQGFVDLHKHA